MTFSTPASLAPDAQAESAPCCSLPGSNQRFGFNQDINILRRPGETVHRHRHSTTDRVVEPFLSKGANQSQELLEKVEHDGYAPYLSNILAFACRRRMRYLASKIPRLPELAPVSVKRWSLSEPLTSECSRTGCGCHE